MIAALSRLARKTRGKKNKRCRKLLNAERTYFTNQRERLDYAQYQARGLPTGSGMVEAACKTLATQRLKRSGMSWRDGKQAILTIRSLQQSNRWAAAGASRALPRPSPCGPSARSPSSTGPGQEGRLVNRGGVSFRATPMSFGPQSRIHLAEVRITLYGDTRHVIQRMT